MNKDCYNAREILQSLRADSPHLKEEYLCLKISLLLQRNTKPVKEAMRRLLTKSLTRYLIYVNGFHGYILVQTNELGLRETINGHPTRFELWDRKKHTIVFQVSGHH